MVRYDKLRAKFFGFTNNIIGNVERQQRAMNLVAAAAELEACVIKAHLLFKRRKLAEI
ncbi:MAG: hypothetical protein V8S87_03545 [Oscillospiraceae bacterium]